MEQSMADLIDTLDQTLKRAKLAAGHISMRRRLSLCRASCNMNMMPMGNCIGGCDQLAGPPPDFILSMPPPPLPSFLMTKQKNYINSLFQSNESQPCFAVFMCGQKQPHNDSGNELMELVQSDTENLENICFFVSSCIGIFALVCFLTLILLRCRDTLFSYHDANIKQSAINALGEATKSNAFTSGGILYPCATANSRDLLQSQLVNDSRLLWATLTPHGTRHFIMENSQDEQYEAVDYGDKSNSEVFRGYTKHSESFVKSFDNNGFIDYDYEDPTPLMDSYHDDLDSGYQEPQEATGSFKRSPLRTLLSSPTNSDIPKMNAMNYGSNQAITSLSINRKAITSRRISDVSSHN